MTQPTIIAGQFGGTQPQALFSPAVVAGLASAGVVAGSVTSTLPGTVSYAVLSGAIQVNATTGAVTTTAAAPVSGSIPGVVTVTNGTAVVATPVSVPVVPHVERPRHGWRRLGHGQPADDLRGWRDDRHADREDARFHADDLAQRRTRDFQRCADRAARGHDGDIRRRVYRVLDH